MRHQTLKQKARQIEILSTLSKLDFATRRQLQAIHALGSIRNANRILKDLRQYCHVTSHNREYVYYLNKKGSALLGLDPNERKKKHQLEHILLRNEAWMWLDFPNWKTEQVIKFRYQNEEKIIVPDAYYLVDQVPHFVEIDRVQHMKINEDKIKYYGLIAKLYKKQRDIVPNILFFTISDYREKKLESYGIKYNVHVRTFLLKEVL
ncbi:replication-relaxation family protein [Bacillus cereus group sp. N28]|uniref:replication-relaxation family protein n=1 Tax=Bacillus cereus group sp. N28 TaxID=2794593 RepID=UPI0018F7C04F|nr:replication-relaxation family protein [Bacillus cereus group sp. N28]MBJ7961456.1 replication-relaxation family protein [Bacillus cereus group sp. N28]